MQAPAEDAVARIRQAAADHVAAGRAEAALASARRRSEGGPPEGRRLAALELGVLHRLSYDYALADSVLSALVDGDRDRVALAARMELAALAQRRGDVPRARTHLETAVAAASRLGDAHTAAEAELVLAGLDMRAGATAAAWSRIARADSLARDAPPRTRALVHCQRASLLGFGARAEAAAEARRGAALASAGGAVRVEAQCLLSMGAGFAQRGMADSAMPVLNAAIARARAAGDDPVLAAAFQWRGFLHRSLGRLGDAHLDLLDAVNAAERSDTRGPLAWAWLNLALISAALRDPADAHAWIVRASAELERQGDRWGLESARQVQGAVLAQLGEFTQAESLTVASLAWARASGALANEGNALTQLVALARARGLPVLAAARLDSLERLYRRPEMRAWRANLDFQRGLLAAAAGRLEEAEGAYRTFLPRLERSQSSTRFAAHARLAEVLALRGDAAGAAAELTLAMDQLDAERARLGDAALRQLVFQMTGDPTLLELGLASTIGAIARRGGAGAAFALAERRRARELGDRLVRLSAIAGRGGATRPAGAVRLPSLPEFTAALQHLDAAALLFVAGREQEPVTMLAVDARGVAAFTLPSVDSIARLARRATDALAGGSATASDPLRRLHAMLITPALAHLGPGIRRLVVVPEGPLYHVPFAALEDPSGAPLVTRWAVVIAPSASLLVEALGRPRRAGGGRLLVLADPVRRPASTPTRTGAIEAVFEAAGATGALPGARREARLVGRYASVRDVRTGRHATEDALLGADLRDVSVLHIASHAVVDDVSALRTAIALAPAGADDGFLTASDVAALDLVADLVVLSACRTARGRVIGGEGLQGLAGPFLAAGARLLVASQWEVRDDATATLMDDLYAALARGAVAADALAEAQRRAIARGDPAQVWAAFTAIGDPAAHPPSLREPPDARWRWLVLVLAAAGIAVATRGAGRARAAPAEPSS